MVIVLVITRFLFLDQDAPSYMVGGVTQDDEPYYSLGAIGKYNADEGRLIKGFEQVYGEALLLFNTHITYFSLKIFGNNYWGLRLPAVLISLMTILLLADILRVLKINKNYLLLILLYALTDFYFFLFSRFQAPQIYAVLAITWVLWLYFKYGLSSNKGLFWIGFFIFFAASFIYMLNLFLLMAFGLLVLRQCYNQKKLKPLAIFGLGVISCLLLYMGALAAISSSFSDITQIVTKHGGGLKSVPSGVAAVIKDVYSRLIQLPVTNLFRYNLSVLFVFFFAFPYIIYKIVRERDEKHMLYFLFTFALILQAFFSVNYSFKKLIIVFPMVVIVLADVLPAAILHYRQLKNKRKIYLLLYGMILLGLCLINLKLNNSKAYWDGLKIGYYENVPFIFNIINLLVLGITVSFVSINLFFDRMKYSWILIFPAGLGMLFISKYCLFEPSFYEKEGFKKASVLLQDKGVIMGLSYTAQFYTNCKPALSCYGDLYQYGEKRYQQIGDSLFRCGAAEFTIEKTKGIKLSQVNENPDFIEVMTIPTRFSSLHVYKYKGQVISN